MTNSKKRLVAYFSTKEATLSLMGTAEKPLRLLYDIPHEKHSAVISIESKRHQRNRVAMEKMPRTYRFFE